MIIDIEGMTCDHCRRAVESALRELPGAGAVEVNLAEGWARLEGTVDPLVAAEAVREEGYSAVIRTE